MTALDDLRLGDGVRLEGVIENLAALQKTIENGYPFRVSEGIAFAEPLALANDVPASEILNKGPIAGMDIVGEKMENGDMFIPQVLMAAKAMGSCVEILKPLMGEGEAAAGGNVLIGTVKGDLHDIGKNLVAMMMESAEMTVHNLGIDIAPEDFVAQIKEKNAQIVCLSALLTTTMPMMKQTVDAIVETRLIF